MRYQLTRRLAAAIALLVLGVATFGAGTGAAGATDREYDLKPSCSSWPTITDDGRLIITNRSHELNGNAGSTQFLQVWTNNRIVGPGLLGDFLAPGESTDPLPYNAGTVILWAGRWYRAIHIVQGCTEQTTTTTEPTTSTTEPETTTTTEGTTTTTEATTTTTAPTTTTTEQQTTTTTAPTTTTTEQATTTTAPTTTSSSTPDSTTSTSQATTSTTEATTSTTSLNLNCPGAETNAIATQQLAQALLDADPSDPHGLDGPIGPNNGNGIACDDEGLTGVSVLSSAVGPIERLPHTGDSTARNLQAAGALLMTGGLLTLATRRRRHRAA